MMIASAIVAIARGSTPCRIIGSTMAILKPQPKSAMNSPIPSTAASQNGAPASLTRARMRIAGSITNSPWAKLMVCEVCQTSVKPMAASA